MILVLFIASWQFTAPWNFPDEQEWNRPMEFGFEQVVNSVRRFFTHKHKVLDGIPYAYDEITQSYFPDFGLMLKTRREVYTSEKTDNKSKR